MIRPSGAGSFWGNWALEAVEASEVAEAAEVNEAGKARKITTEDFSVEFLTVELYYFLHFVHGFAEAVVYYFIKRVRQNGNEKSAFFQ